MAAPTTDDATFIAEMRALGPAGYAKKYGVTDRQAFARRRSIERRYGIEIAAPIETAFHHPSYQREEYPQRICCEIKNGIAFVASDFHYWPGKASTVHRAIVKLAKELKPQLFVANGDVCDFATISRHAPIGWEGRPSVDKEIEVSQERLHEIILALPRGCSRAWTLGNHDARFETIIATKLPELAKVKGVHLHNYFPEWDRGWSAWINEDVIVKHRFKGGIHATHNNTVWAGKNIFTGHLHSAKVTPFTDYSGTRYGVDTGCVADPDHKAFVDYTEDNPKNWRSAFCVLTFWRGKLLQPELVLRLDENHVEFRGQVIGV